MRVSMDKLVESLETVRLICRDNVRYCLMCPLSDLEGNCMITDAKPSEWVISRRCANNVDAQK